MVKYLDSDMYRVLQNRVVIPTLPSGLCTCVRFQQKHRARNISAAMFCVDGGLQIIVQWKAANFKKSLGTLGCEQPRSHHICTKLHKFWYSQNSFLRVWRNISSDHVFLLFHYLIIYVFSDFSWKVFGLWQIFLTFKK